MVECFLSNPGSVATASTALGSDASVIEPLGVRLHFFCLAFLLQNQRAGMKPQSTVSLTMPTKVNGCPTLPWRKPRKRRKGSEKSVFIPVRSAKKEESVRASGEVEFELSESARAGASNRSNEAGSRERPS